MAKKKSQKSMHTHIPTHIGFIIITLVALAFALILITQYNSKTHIFGSNASTAKSPIIKPVAPVTVGSMTKKCISYNISGKCVLYQTTTTVVNTKTPCISYNTSGQCTYYQGTTQTNKTWTPTSQPVKKTCTPIKVCLEKDKYGNCLVANIMCK